MSEELQTLSRQPATPMNLLEMAVSNNASMDTIERLVALQERMMEQQARQAFNAAMSRAQAEMGRVGTEQAVFGKRLFEQRAEATQETRLLLAIVGVGGFEEQGGEAFAGACDGGAQGRQAVAFGKFVEHGHHVAGLAAEDQPGEVEAPPHGVVGLGCVEGEDDESAVGLGVDLAFQARGAGGGFEFEAGVGLEARAALDE